MLPSWHFKGTYGARSRLLRVDTLHRSAGSYAVPFPDYTPHLAAVIVRYISGKAPKDSSLFTIASSQLRLFCSSSVIEVPGSTKFRFQYPMILRCAVPYLRPVSPSLSFKPIRFVRSYSRMLQGCTFKNALLRAEGSSMGLWQTLPGANISRILARAGVDWVMVDCEHGNIDGMHNACRPESHFTWLSSFKTIKKICTYWCRCCYA